MIVLPKPFNLHYFDTVDSTNTVAKKLAADGAPDYSLVWADEQTGGRGRFDRKWVSNRGNLFYSLILRLNIDTPPLHELTFVSGLAIADTVREFLPTPTSVTIKWPNDVLINDHKVSGALIEGGGDDGWAVVGIGINVRIKPEGTTAHGDFLQPPSSLMAMGAADTNVSDVCLSLSEKLYKWHQIWLKEGFNGQLRRAYEEQIWRLGLPVKVSFDARKSEFITGTNEGIDEIGCLLIRQDNGELRRIAAGDVLGL